MGKNELRLVVVLVLISMLAGGVLAWVSSLTEPKIQAQAELRKKAALQEALTAASTFQPAEALLENAHAAGYGDLVESYLGYHDTKQVGLVFVADVKGYSSTIRLSIGVSMDGQLSGVKVISQAETPGLGVKITEPEFLEQPAFREATVDDQLAVVKERGRVEAVTGATVSSRAVVRGVNQALAVARVFLAEVTE
ncbi:MAG: RnfABCDGE type electron transport complex subunit G [Firmicutes bacterium]|nr:RnfABCDGE type electron transport complex subunit G [Bacillota bacterium]